MRNIVLALLMLTFVSCRTAKHIPQAQPGSVIKSSSSSSVIAGGETQTGYTKPDSASMKVLLACDSLGNEYIRQIADMKAGLRVKPSVEIRNNFIYVKCEVDSLAVYTKWQRFYKATSDTSNKIEYLPGELTNHLTWFQKLLIKFGWVFIASIALFVIYLIMKFKNPLKLT